MDNESRLEELNRLLQARNASPRDNELETRFYNQVLDYLLTTTHHWWCTDSIRPLAMESLWLFSLPDHEHLRGFKERLNNQLASCSQCAQQYQMSKRSLRSRYETLFSADNVNQFFVALDQFDDTRVLAGLDSPPISDTWALTETMRGAVCETILRLGRLGGEIDARFCRLFEIIHAKGVFPTFDQKVAPGILALVFHHHSTVRLWARKLLDKFLKAGYVADDALFATVAGPLCGLFPSLDVEPFHFRTTDNIDELWKAFRSLLNAFTTPPIVALLDSSNVDLVAFFHDALASSTPSFGEVVRTLHDTLQRLGKDFWRQGPLDEKRAAIIDQICNHPKFQQLMKIGLESNMGKILQRDGTEYPVDKLMARMKSYLDWLPAMWRSVVGTTMEVNVTGRLLDILLGYYQLSTWNSICKQCCGDLAMPLLEKPNRLIREKINVYATSLVSLATSASHPSVGEDLSAKTREIICCALDHDVERLWSFVQPPLLDDVAMDGLWAALEQYADKLPDLIKEHILQAYTVVACLDIPSDAHSDTLPDTVLSVHRIGQTVSAVLATHFIASQDKVERMLEKPGFMHTLMTLAASPFPDRRASVDHLGSDCVDYLFEHASLEALKASVKVLEGVQQVAQHPLDDFTRMSALFSWLHQVMICVCGDEESLVMQVLLAGCQHHPEECSFATLFVRTSWQVIHRVLEGSLSWAERYPSQSVVASVLPALDIALLLTGAQPSFDRLAEHAPPGQPIEQLIQSLLDTLSHWVYVTKREVLDRLVPLVTILLRRLEKVELKMSLEAYDRFMTAATGVNQNRLETDDKETLLLALNAHEPENAAVLLDDSDDEGIEWQEVLSRDPARTDTVASTSSARHVVEEEDIDDMADVDFSQVPEEWFEVAGSSSKKPETKPKSTSTPAAARPPVRQSVLPSFKGRLFTPMAAVRHLRPTPKNGSKIQAIRQMMRGEGRLAASAMSQSAAIARRKKRAIVSSDSDSSNDDDDDDDEDDDDQNGLSGLRDLVADVDQAEATRQEQFKPVERRSVKLLGSPVASLLNTRARQIKIAEQRKRMIAPDIDRLYKTVLSWDAMHQGEKPPHASADMYQRVADRFDSFEKYIQTFEPLLLTEVWTQLIRAKEGLTEADVIDRVALDSRCHTNDFVDLTFHVPSSTTSSFVPDDLICVANHFSVSFFQTLERDAPNPKVRTFLGKVMSSTTKKNTNELLLRCYFPPDRITLMNALTPKTTWRALRLMSLTTAQREYSALLGLEHFELASAILSPTPTLKPNLPQNAIDECIDRYGVNQPQAEAIVGAMHKQSGFTLIQGPPGTGKTMTILGLIGSLLGERPAPATGAKGARQRGKLLVCAPSNAAVDEIAKRLKVGIKTSQGLVQPKVVRIGVMDAVNTSVKDLFLDRLIEKELEKVGEEGSNHRWAARRDKAKEEIRRIQLELEDVDRDLHVITDSSRLGRVRDRRRQLLQEKSRYTVMLKSVYEEQRDHTRAIETSRMKARQKVLGQADVVCATLSGSGHEMLASLGLSFETVVVDEAAQSIEISSLIPLKYGCKCCILVGDPNQLPPTVLSLEAANYSYEQSLFMRLQKSTPDEVYLLSIQYRMHPDISRFPSKLFYESRLQDGPDMASITHAPWHTDWPPYCFYDVRRGQEQTGRGKSLYNTMEADAAVALVDKLATDFSNVKFAYTIGVITPYKQQLSQLKSRFERRFGPRILDVIDFNTVDGFQGQEKDIIVFSCVRAGSGHGIGFLADIRRMNVGLTRAKRSMFIIGHAGMLGKSPYWGELVSDAESRGVMKSCSTPFFGHHLGAVPNNLFEKRVVKTARKPPPRAKRQRTEEVPIVKSVHRDQTIVKMEMIDKTQSSLSPRQPDAPSSPPPPPSSSSPSLSSPSALSSTISPSTAIPMRSPAAGPMRARRPHAPRSRGPNLFIPKHRRPKPAQTAAQPSHDEMTGRERIQLEFEAAKQSLRDAHRAAEETRQRHRQQQQQSRSTLGRSDRHSASEHVNIEDLIRKTLRKP